MKTKSRVYDVDAKKMRFSFQAFIQIFNTYRKRNNMNVSELEHYLAESLGVADNTVHKWRGKKHGPIDVEMVKKIANVLGIQDFTLLLTECVKEENVLPLSERQTASAKKLYDACLVFLNEFFDTDGFRDDWLAFKNAGSDHPEEDTYKKVKRMLRHISLVCDQEYFDLHSHPIYDEFCEHISDDIYVIYSNKNSDAYRFETISDDNDALMEEFDRAMIQLNSIVDKYIK